MVIGQSVWFYACYVVFCCLLICTQFLMCCRVVQAVQFTVHSLCLTLALPQTLVLKNFLLRVIITSKKNMSAKLSILLYGGWNGTKAMHTTWRERSYMVHKIVVLCLGALYVLVIEPILVLNLVRARSSWLGLGTEPPADQSPNRCRIVNVNVNLYSASSQKCASNALIVPSTD